MQPQLTDEYLCSQGMSPTFPKRFWEKVKKTESCWFWTASVNNRGYGSIKPKFRINCMLAHRASWILIRGPIPEGMNVLHNCPGGDNRNCVNPDHLWLGTIAENNADMMNKGRAKYPALFIDMSGENNPSCKMRLEAVQAMRAEFAKGGIEKTSIAKRFGMSYAQTHRILTFKSWKQCAH